MDVSASQESERNDHLGRGVLDDLDVLGFEHAYEAAGDDLTRVPWAGLRAHPLLCAWLDDHPEPAGQRALVIACGLGDDAEELRRRGFAVTAFDASPTAIGWCRKRFPDSTVAYHVADLFNLPPGWRQAYDLVVEIHTIQALPPPRHGAVIAAIAQTVAPGGKVVVITFGRPETEEARNGPPWPLRRSELAAFAAEGLREMDGFEDSITNEHLGPNPILRWRIVYERPKTTATQEVPTEERRGG